MMDELKQQFYEVMHKYQKPFSEEGVTANLTQWYEQKQGLLQLLRRHPLWNEKELAIVFRVEERREIDRATVDETRAAILELGRRACTDDTVYENFETALRASTADYARIPNEYRLDTIRQYGDIKCAPGQKASRIINRLCLKFHLDQIEEEAEAGEPDNRYMRTVKPYNALFARLADALNPAHIEKTAVLSIHPCDFLEMSNRDNTWSSCHCLEGGGYRGGCQSYMGDAVSMIFFTVSDEYTQDFHTAPRITREIFCYKDNQTKVLEHKGNVTTRTKDKTKLVSYIECDTNKSPRQHLGDCCYLVPIYRFRKILAALGSGISQLTYRSFNGQAWGSRICSSIQPL